MTEDEVLAAGDGGRWSFESQVAGSGERVDVGGRAGRRVDWVAGAPFVRACGRVVGRVVGRGVVLW